MRRFLDIALDFLFGEAETREFGVWEWESEEERRRFLKWFRFC